MKTVNTKRAYVAPEITVHTVDVKTSLLDMSSPSSYSVEERNDVIFDAQERYNLSGGEEDGLW